MESFEAQLVKINRRHGSNCTLWGAIALRDGTFRAAVPAGNGSVFWRTAREVFATAEEASAAAKLAWRARQSKLWRLKESNTATARALQEMMLRKARM